jgi:hypothetical protein
VRLRELWNAGYRSRLAGDRCRGPLDGRTLLGRTWREGWKSADLAIVEGRQAERPVRERTPPALLRVDE